MGITLKTRRARLAIALSGAYLILAIGAMYWLAGYLATSQHDQFISTVCETQLTSPQPGDSYVDCLAGADERMKWLNDRAWYFAITRAAGTLIAIWLIVTPVLLVARWVRKGER
ncbi:hypothetical protein SAMN03159338_1497 [Sphingomonas sp. NFR04]|uniref:hypothetical protein n=1 Tax=Sphingomonas sp. NFR04 TaxID=1566283 RepID=UPI0008E822ED|nr:hypothetical protein [Sphingomonas sp. NFR04]SFJ47584.1 hypothetical protein SAMN03159338_1497 [Sphingomonas sp. NFR04]